MKAILSLIPFFWIHFYPGTEGKTSEKKHSPLFVDFPAPSSKHCPWQAFKWWSLKCVMSWFFGSTFGKFFILSVTLEGHYVLGWLLLNSFQTFSPQAVYPQTHARIWFVLFCWNPEKTTGISVTFYIVQLTIKRLTFTPTQRNGSADYFAAVLSVFCPVSVLRHLSCTQVIHTPSTPPTTNGETQTSNSVS